MTVQLDLLDSLVASLPPRLYLCRVNPRRRMSRFYVLAIEPTLFGGYSLARAYGRIGRGGAGDAAVFRHGRGGCAGVLSASTSEGTPWVRLRKKVTGMAPSFAPG
ncbi:WGR domain-containing protein [Jiella pacifica]|uniref:WGR domain-containing protein n=1 Tax=Jiella pacifica TaxID=2696469 RepID=A0A6N9TDQ5_9HYPH|nr:WGR domain-containing protein [Jiella pacifica]NDW07809.1 WGR domain-containing protein [Jiella pacifica]